MIDILRKTIKNEMKITIDNYKIVSKKDHNLLYSLLIDLDEINNILESKGYDKIYIDYIDSHTEYSPERTDPCPDYYGMYKLYSISNKNESIGIEMTIDDLDMILCTLINFTEILFNKR